MNVASLELCRELFDLSGWDFEHSFAETRWYADNGDIQIGFNPDFNIPAYDLGYLMRKLPKSIGEGSEAYDLTIQAAGSWFASYDLGNTGRGKYGQICATPEDAAAKLAIELFKQKVLKK